MTRIVFCTTCKNRTQHLRQTLPVNLADNPSPDNRFIVLDYGSQDDLLDYLRTVNDPRLIVYSCSPPGPFHVAHAKNMAARLGILEGADILVTVDADNYTGPNFDRFILDRSGFGTFLCPDFPRIQSLPHGPSRPNRGYAGRLAIRSQEFIKAGGYDELFDTWRGEDIDMIARLQRMGYAMRLIDNRYLNAIPHDSKVRFREYPHAEQYENKREVKVIYARTETVVNYGKFGCGLVYRNFGIDPIAIKPLPTRIFGVGLHKTSTSSLHSAFKLLGFDSFHWESNKKSWDIWAEMTTLDRSPTLERYYALCDLPIPMLYKQLDSTYPGSKFILTVRDETKWLKSIQGLWNPKINPWYDWDKQPFSHQIHKALYGRTDFDAQTFLQKYRQHNAEVQDYFKNRPQDLLVLNMEAGAGWPELCPFLNKPIPDQPYPVEYKTKELSK